MRGPDPATEVDSVRLFHHLGNGWLDLALSGGPRDFTAELPAVAMGIDSVALRLDVEDSTGNRMRYEVTLPVSTSPQLPIFSDGFESGNTSAWSSTLGN